MTADNYIAVVISHEKRRVCGIALHELIFPFDSRDMKTITAAAEAAHVMKERVEHLDMLCELATFAPCDMLDDLAVIFEREELVAMRQKSPAAPRVFRSKYGGEGTPYGYRNRNGVAA